MSAFVLFLGNATTIQEGIKATDIGGSSFVWDDLSLALSAAKVPAANAPTWTSFVGNLKRYTYSVNDFQEWDTEFQHGLKEGTDFEFHLHGVTNGLEGIDTKIKYEIEYTLANTDPSDGIGDVFPAPTIVNAEFTIPANTPDRSNHYMHIATISGAACLIDAQIDGRVRRIASAGPEPAADPFLLRVGVHYQKNTFGSLTETEK